MQGLKEQRLSLKMTQAEIAEKLNVTPTTWAMWERGEVEPNAPGMLELALEALQTRALLNNIEFQDRQQKILANIESRKAQMGQRIKHSKVTS